MEDLDGTLQQRRNEEMGIEWGNSSFLIFELLVYFSELHAHCNGFFSRIFIRHI